MLFKKTLFIDSRDPFISTHLDGGTTFGHFIISFIIQHSLKSDVIIYSQISNETKNIFNKTLWYKNNYVEQNKFSCSATEITKRKVLLETLTERYNIVFIKHTSNAFGLTDFITKNPDTLFVLFPMFSGISYEQSKKHVPNLYKRYEAETLKLMDVIVSPSKMEKSQLATKYHVDFDKITVIPRGYDENVFKFIKREPFKKINIVCVGAIKPQKDIHLLIDIAEILVKKNINFKVYLIGWNKKTNSEEYKNYADSCKKRINTSISKNHFEIVEFLPQCKLIFYLHNAHIAVSTSIFETFGKSILEAMATGLPAILPNDIECFTEIYSNTKGVMLVKRDANIFATTIIDISNCYDDYLSRSIQAYDHTDKYKYSEITNHLKLFLQNKVNLKKV